MKKILVRTLLVLLVLTLILTVGAYVLLSGGRPDRSGEHALAGLSASVDVRFDRWGVPAIRAASEEDLIAALGFIHANDRITQMELGRRAAFGRLSEILGEATVDLDVYFRTLRLRSTAEAMWRDVSPESRTWLEAYARGVNAWLTSRGDDLPPELRLLGVRPEPWREIDSIAFALLMARDLSFWNDRPEEQRYTWMRAFGTERMRHLLGDPDVHVPEAIAALARGEAPPEPEAGAAAEEPSLDAPGSNNWALAPRRTRAGRAMVANDPHLPLRLPSVWFQVHLRSPTYEAAGMSLPGAPGIVLGRGEHVAWAFTNVMLDDHDVFFEILDDAGENVRRGDDWSPIARESVTIEVKDGEPRELVLRTTDRGPLLDADDERELPARSLVWTAHFGGDPLLALRRLAISRTPDEALAAVETFVAPAQNLVAGFATGELLYTAIGHVPNRRRGDGRLPSPGWDPSYGWDGLRPRDTNPTVRDPEDGLLVTANADIVPPGYPLDLVADFYPGHRARRIRQVLGERTDWTFEGMATLQTDTVSLYADELLNTVSADIVGLSGEASKAWQHLALWDRSMAPRGPSALYALFQRELITSIFTDEAELAELNPFVYRDALLRLVRGEIDEHYFDDVRTDAVETREEILAAALETAFREGNERWGRKVSRWDYGEMHSLVLRHPLDAAPILGALLRRGPFPVGGSATTPLAFGFRWQDDRMAITYGPSMRFITDWSQPDVAFVALPGGQSGHLMDPHYDDRLDAYLGGRLHLSAYSEERIERLTVARLALEPAP